MVHLLKNSLARPVGRFTVALSLAISLSGCAGFITWLDFRIGAEENEGVSASTESRSLFIGPLIAGRDCSSVCAQGLSTSSCKKYTQKTIDECSKFIEDKK